MENKLFYEISIDGTEITQFSNFTLIQRFNEHHSFELRINQDQIEQFGDISLNKTKEYMGKSLTVQFGKLPGKENIFTGIITRVEFSQSHGLRGDIIIKGYSPTILIDRGPDLGSYLEKDLKTIIEKVTADAPANDLNLQINPSNQDVIDYIIQYRESDFDFMNRLSAEYHEWFFYNGIELYFGKPDEQKEVKVTYGQDLQTLQYGLQIAPLKYKRFSYNPKEDEVLSSDGEGTATGTTDLMHSIEASNKVYSKVYNLPLSIRVDTKKDIDTYVDNEQKAIKSELLTVQGEGDNPEVGIGCIVDIGMSLKKDLSFSNEEFGRFLVTGIRHELDGVGHYYHVFDAVAADTEKIAVKEIRKPLADMQIADVIDNADPKGQGRIKVKFKWTCTCNDVTEWLRVITPDAGSSDKVSKNRGFAFVPEKDDQVIVAFEEGNIARPIVLGSVYHGKSGSGGGDTNKTKSLTTRSGNTIIMDDSNGSINMKDPSGNVVTMHGDGTVTITAPNKLTINTIDFVLNASNSISINAQPGEQGGGEGRIAISAKKTIAATADTEGITIDATVMGVAITGKTDVSLASTDAAAYVVSKTDLNLGGQDVAMNAGATIRINSADTDIT